MIPQISVQELAAKLAERESVYLLDVRQPEEHAIAALPNSTLIPLDTLRGSVGNFEPPPDTLVVVYCHHGIRSLTATWILQEAGIRQVASLSGGIDAWSRKIDPTVPRY